MRRILAAAVLIPFLAGCSSQPAKQAPAPAQDSSRSVPASSEGAVPAPSFDDQDVRRYLHIGPEKFGEYTYRAPDGTRCELAVILAGALSVSLYADAGDNVASNPTRTAGVKIVDEKGQKCHALLTRALADFPGGGQ